ncbi:hypothetical protein [Aeoliella sp.]|uniref:hypothetical protein n=1 Tax=Aeoliella sp. TaxID=2795800 RepID=UPI003CCB8819
MRFLLLSIVPLALSGCHSHNVHRFSDVDETQKSVTVPPGGKGLKGKLKTALRDDGWELVVYSGPEVTEGSVGDKTQLKRYNTFNTRYSLFVVSRTYDYCLNLDPAITYDVSLVDNKTGTEVVTLDGKGCEGRVVDEFSKALHK